MSDLDAARREALRAYRDRASWRSAPGVWSSTPNDGMSRESRESVAAILSRSVSAGMVEAALDALTCHVIDYRLWRRRWKTPQGDAFRSWHRSATKRLQDVADWLRVDPLPSPVEAKPNGDALEQLTWEREHLTRQIEYFIEWLSDAYAPSSQRGRPVDWLRSDLVGCTGTILALAGAPVTKSEDGLYARILAIVLADVGLRPDSQAGESLHQTVRTAIDAHPEWRRLIEIGPDAPI